MNINILNDHPPSPLCIFPPTNILNLQRFHLVLERVQGTSKKLDNWFDVPSGVIVWSEQGSIEPSEVTSMGDCCEYKV
jgi:hypothetical protein